MESKINIPQPCNENWHEMLPNKQGRFCTSCDKTVVDFTKMNKPQILKYFSESANNEMICGYYTFDQVENESTIKYNNLRNRFSQIKVKPIKIVALFSLSFLFTFTSCIMGKRAEAKPEEVIENDTISNNEITTNEKDVANKNDSVKKKQDLLKKKSKILNK